jgi:hypothetical protein
MAASPNPPGTAADPLPLRHTVEPDHPLLGALILLVAGVWIGVPLLALADGRPALPSLGPIGSYSLVAVGIVQLLWALDVLLRRQTLTIAGNALQMAERGLLGVRRWHEPLAHFRGLRHRRQRVRGQHGWRVVHRLELVHAEPSRAICLLRSCDEGRVSEAARRFAHGSGLPTWSASP